MVKTQTSTFLAPTSCKMSGSTWERRYWRTAHRDHRWMPYTCVYDQVRFMAIYDDHYELSTSNAPCKPCLQQVSGSVQPEGTRQKLGYDGSHPPLNFWGHRKAERPTHHLLQLQQKGAPSCRMPRIGFRGPRDISRLHTADRTTR